MQGNDDILALTHTIARIIEDGADKTKSMSSPCIFRVRNELRKLKKSAYTPQLVSIGPLHSNDKHILKSPMEDIKKRYVRDLFRRMKTADSKIDKLSEMRKCVEKMKQLLDKAKKCYSQVENVNGPDENTEDKDKAKKCHEEKEKVDSLDVKMLVIDGCFILEFLFRYYHTYKPDADSSVEAHHDERTQSSSNQNSNNEKWTDFAFDSCQNRGTIQTDLLLLENQLPWFVLEELFGLTVAHIPNHLLLSDYVLSYFSNMMYSTKDEGCRKNREGVEHMHILHLLFDQFRPHQSFKEENGGCTKNWECGPCSDSGQVPMLPPASELTYAGVKFKGRGSSNRTGSGGGDHNVQFNCPEGPFWCVRSAYFELPTLQINQSTEILWRNLIAFEQCYHGVELGHRYTSYAALMDRLINTENDVQVLEKAGVLRNSLGDRKEASDLFNKLCEEIVLPGENSYFAKTCNKAANYSKCCWPSFIAYGKGKFFASPWTFAAFFVAFITFAMSVTQFMRGLLR